MSIDWSKPIEVVSAGTPRPARVVCSDRKNAKAPLLVLEDTGDEEILWHVDKNGGILGTSYFVRNKPERKTRYANVYQNGSVGCWHNSRQACDWVFKRYPHCRAEGRIGLVKIVVEGEGDEARLVSAAIV